MQNSLSNISLFQFFDNEPTKYAKQTVISLFRTLLETMLDSRSDALVIFKADKFKDVEGILNRISYSNSKIFSYTDFANIPNFIKMETPEELGENFLLIYAHRFSVALVFDKSDTEGFYNANVALNATVIKEIYEYLKEVSDFALFDKYLAEMQLDRRGNLIFDIILNKLLSKVEEYQRDLLCADSETSTPELDVKSVLKKYSHELRNSIGILGVYGKLIKNCADKVASNHYDNIVLTTMKNASFTIGKALNNIESILFEMSNYSETFQINLFSENINDIIQEIVEFMTPSLAKKNVEIDFSSKYQGEANIDKNKFSQVMLNLLKNAYEASKENSQIKVTLEKQGDEIFIDVKDFGEGVSLEMKAKIFRQYFTTKDAGQGIGLFVSKEIIEAHNGKLELLETSENGSTFRITLPLAKGGC